MNMRRFWAGIGRHRAVDYIPVLKAENASLRARLADADTLIVSLVHERNAANRKARSAMAGLEQAAVELEAALTENAALAAENDEQAHRIIGLRAELANLRQISVTAPADWPDEDTVELPLVLSPAV